MFVLPFTAGLPHRLWFQDDAGTLDLISIQSLPRLQKQLDSLDAPRRLDIYARLTRFSGRLPTEISRTERRQHRFSPGGRSSRLEPLLCISCSYGQPVHDRAGRTGVHSLTTPRADQQRPHASTTLLMISTLKVHVYHRVGLKRIYRCCAPVVPNVSRFRGSGQTRMLRNGGCVKDQKVPM